MPEAPKFDPTESVTFDLPFGHVHLDSAPNRVLIPASQLVGLCQAATPEAVKALADAMGEVMAKRASLRLAQGAPDRLAEVREASFDAVVEQVAAELALAGLGALSAERWGRALVLVHDQSPLGVDGDGFVAMLLETALGSLSGAELRVVVLERDAVRVRFFVCAQQTARAVGDRLAGGEHWASVVATLHQRGDRAATSQAAP